MNEGMRVPFFDYPKLFERNRGEYLRVIEEVLSRGAYIMQSDLEEFENELASFLGVDYAVGVADGTMGLLMSLRAMNIGRGDEVILPSHTFVSDAAVIEHLGATPVLVDCSADHLVDSNSIRSSISNKTKAIIPVHLNGRVANMTEIMEISSEFNLAIVEDACQALGATLNGEAAGTFGDAGVFSFFPAKTLGAFGDGGAVVAKDYEVARKLRMLRDHGRDPVDGIVKLFGYNARLDNLQAAVLSINLKNYKSDIDRRRELAGIYQNRLDCIDGVMLPPAPNQDASHFDIFQNYEIEAVDRDRLSEFLGLNGIGVIIQWGGRTIHQFTELGLAGSLPYTEQMSTKFLLLPMHSMLSDGDVHLVCDKVIEFYN